MSATDRTDFDDRVLAECRRNSGSNFYPREIRAALGDDTTSQAVTAAMRRLETRGLLTRTERHPAKIVRGHIAVHAIPATWWNATEGVGL